MVTKDYPPFSVLISVYKNEKPSYLDKALKSIENQSVRPSEIVLVEDGPISEELKSIIVKHQERMGKMFKDIVSESNQGLGASLKLGTKYVSTDWIARMDSDDISVHDRFELQLKEIVKNPKLAIIGGQVQEFAGEPSNIVGYRKVPISECTIQKFIKWRSPFNHPSVILNKSVLQEVGGYLPYGNLEDYYLWSRIVVQKFHVKNINQVLVKMRVDEGMYQRRGRFSNIKYFYRLRKFMYKKNLLTWLEMVIGDWIMTISILIPGFIRKFIYENILH